MSSDPVLPPAPQPEAKRPRSRHLSLSLRRFGIRAAKFLLAQAPRLVITLLLRSLGAAFDQQARVS